MNPTVTLSPLARSIRNKQSGNAMLSMLMATVLMSSFVVWQGKQMVDERKNQSASLAARQLAQVTETVAGRMAELEDRFTTVYPSGAPTTDLRWLKNPATCSIPGIPARPNRPDGTPITESFLPCDFPDINESGSAYFISWTGPSNNLVAHVNVGDPTLPFTFHGDANGRFGGFIARKANAITEGGRERGMHRIYVSYSYDPDSNVLTGIADQTAPVPIRPESDPHSLHTDGSVRMDSGARIRWTGSNAWVGQDGHRAWVVGVDATFWGDNEVRVQGGNRLVAQGGTGGVTVTSGGGVTVNAASGVTVSAGGAGVFSAKGAATLSGDTGVNVRANSGTATIYGRNGITLQTVNASTPINITSRLTVSGNVTSSGSVEGLQFNPTKAFSVGGSCSPVGALGRDASGNTLNCVDSKWALVGGSAGMFSKVTRNLQRMTESDTWTHKMCFYTGMSHSPDSCLLRAFGPNADGLFTYTMSTNSARCYVTCYD